MPRFICATPIDPPIDGKCWAFHLVNDSSEPVTSIWVKSVSFEWGDMGNTEQIDRRVGPVAPGACCELHREVDSEMRTAIELEVDGQPMGAEFPRLYRVVPGLVRIPVLGRLGLMPLVD